MTEILKRITTANNKGAFLESIIESVFKDHNYLNVRKQRSGSQYGFDIVGYKNGECWKAECKNLNAEATINDIAPKLVWHIDSLTVDRFLIVSVNGISNDLYHLLEQRIFSFPIEIWYGDYLEKKISESPSALKRLSVCKSDILINQNSAPLIFPPNDLKIGVTYSKGEPFSFDYFRLGNDFIKAYSEFDFRIIVTLTNKTNRTFLVKKVVVKTSRFNKTNNTRIVRQFTQKGIVEPIKLTFIPAAYLSGKAQLSEEKLIEVKGNTNEYIEFKLSQKCESGYYELIFEFHCTEEGRSFSLFSPIFPLHKGSAKDDMVKFCVMKYYDTPMVDILNLDDDTWSTIKQEYTNQIKFLGPTITDTFNKRDLGKTWTVNLLKGKRIKQNGTFSLDIKATRKSTVLVDLKIPIKEKIYSLDDAIERVINSNKI